MKITSQITGKKMKKRMKITIISNKFKILNDDEVLLFLSL